MNGFQMNGRVVGRSDLNQRAVRVLSFTFRSSEAIHSGGATSDEENPGPTTAEMCK